MTIYSTIITLRPTRSYGTTTIQEKTDNKDTETSTSVVWVSGGSGPKPQNEKTEIS